MPLVLIAALFTIFGSCGRNLDNGTFTATVQTVNIDTCLDPQDLKLHSTFALTLDVQGDTVLIRSDSPELHGAGGKQDPRSSNPRPEFFGRFLYGQEQQVFIADTNFEVVKDILNASPSLGLVSCDSLVHLAITHAVVDTATHFTGTLRKTYEPRPDAALGCDHDCVVEVGFDAVKP